MMNRILASLSLLAATCVWAQPAMEPVEPSDTPPVPSTQAGLAPASARGMVFEFLCSEAHERGGEDAESSVCDVRATFHSMDRTEMELDVEDEHLTDEQHHMRILNYTKTGADTASITGWEGVVTDDGDKIGGVNYEIRLTFTSGTEGTAVILIYGHGVNSYGRGRFTLHH